MQHFLKPSVMYQRQREDWRNHRDHLANLLLRIFTVSYSADRRLIIRAFSQSSCHQSARTRLRWEENLVLNSGNYTSLQHLQFFRYNVWSWSFVSLGSPKSEDTHLHEHTPAIEYTGNKKKKKSKRQWLPVICLRTIFAVVFSPVSFRLPKRTLKTQTPPFSCLNFPFSWSEDY